LAIHQISKGEKNKRVKDPFILLATYWNLSYTSGNFGKQNSSKFAKFLVVFAMENPLERSKSLGFQSLP
jgi:hypothetical protein